MSDVVNDWQRDPVKVARFRRIQEDLDWAAANFADLEQQYAGEYVVVWQKQVIDHGPSLEELLNRASTAEHPREELAVVEVPAFFEVPR